MNSAFASVCDEFYVNMRLASHLQLPHGRETVLHLFDRIGRAYPGMDRIRRGEHEISLEEPRVGSHRWLTLETRRLCCGHVNPASVDEALGLHSLLLELAPFHLGLSPIETEFLEVLFGFDLAYQGNHDEVVAESLLSGSPLASLMDIPSARAIDVQPSFTFSLSDDCRLQAGINIITRTNSEQVRTGQFPEDVISVYLFVRRYWAHKPGEPLEQTLAQLAGTAVELCEEHVVPNIVRPLSTAIASRS